MIEIPTGYTKGLWGFIQGTPPHYQARVYDETGKTIAITYNDESGANAELIALAPELAAEVERLRETYDAVTLATDAIIDELRAENAELRETLSRTTDALTQANEDCAKMLEVSERLRAENAELREVVREAISVLRDENVELRARSPFGPSTGNHLEAALGKLRAALAREAQS